MSTHHTEKFSRITCHSSHHSTCHLLPLSNKQTKKRVKEERGKSDLQETDSGVFCCCCSIIVIIFSEFIHEEQKREE
jgi:hypothetical protein